MSRLPGISDLFRSRSQARRRKPKRRREAERFAGRMESLESRAMLAFTTLPASGDMGGLPIILSSDASGPNVLTIVLDDITKLDIGEIAATITTSDGQAGQYWNFSDINYAASNDTDGSVVNTVKLWTSYEADVLGYETAPADDSEVGLATSWFVASRFPAGGAPVVLSMLNADSLTVTSGVIGGGASTIAGEFESPTLAPALNAATGANITLISGTSVTGTDLGDLGGTTDLEPIVAYTLTLQSQTAGVTLDTDVFTVGDLTINAAGTITLNGLLQSTSGDIEVESTSGQILLDGAELHALDGGITLRTLKEGIVQVAATAPNPRWQDYIVAETDVTIEAGGEVVLIGGVRANTGDIELSSTDRGIQFTGEDAVLHAVVGSVEINATRGPATLQNLFANKSITVNALGDVSLNGTFQTTSGDLVVNSDGNIGNSARLLIGGSLTLDGGLNVSSLGGGIVRLELLSGGTNYEYAIVTIAPPAAGGGRAALARAVINPTTGEITGLTIVDPGYGYAPNEQVAVSIEGNPAVPGPPSTPAGSGAFATAFAGSTLSSMQAGRDLAITAGTAVDITNELRAESGNVTVAVSAGPLSLSDIFAGTGVSLTAAQTIDLGGLVRTAAGDVSVESKGGGVDVGATLLAPAGGAKVTAAGQIVQRGGSVSRDRLFLLSGGRDYTYALVVVDPPPGAGQAALARAVITYYNPLDPSEGGFISDIVLLDPGWGYPSDSRVNVSIQGDGEGATAVFATDIVTSSIDVRDDVTVEAGDAITLVSSLRSSAGNVTLRNTTGDLAVQSVTSKLAAEVESERGKVTLVSVAAGGNVDIAAFRGVSVTDSVNTTAGDIAVTTINGDLQFVQGFDFGDNYLVNADATALQPLAVIATAAGGIALRSDNGSITTPFVINATDDVTITSFGLLEATNEITSTNGDVELRSTSGLVQLGANVAAVGGSITVAAHTQLRQQVSSGVSKIQLLSPGEVVEDTAPQVTVTVAAPRNGGTAATAVAIIERRSTGDGFGADDDEYFLGGIAIIDAGQGYAVGEQPSVTITGINGASARAFGPLNAAMLTAGDGITLTAGEDLTLVTKVHSTTGSVVVQSAAGNIDLSDRSLLLSTAAGAISVDAPRGTVVVQRAAAAEDVTIVGLGGITVLGSVVSEDAGITLKALDGAVDARQVNAADDVTITAFKSGKLAGEIASSAGAVSFTSLAGGLFLEANIVAAGAVDIDAQTFILQDGRSGVERIDVIDGGSATGAVAPTVTVTVAAPVAGGTAARAQAVIGQRSATEYFIESIYIIDPGTGYALGEVAEVTITGMAGASARAFGPTNLRNVTGGTGVTLEAGDDITLVNTVTATTGDVVVSSKTGNLQLDANGFLARAAEGSVSLTGSAGSVFVQRASASEDVTLFGAKGVVVLGSVDAGNDASVVTGADGRVSVTRIVAGDSVTVTAGDDVELLDLVDAATGGVLVTSTAGNLATRRIYAELDITLKTADQVYLLGVLESAAGDIAVESVAGSVELYFANLLASGGAITVTARGVVNQPTGTGVVDVRELDPGQFVGATAPTVDVTIAAPAGGGGTAATARAIVRRIGFVPVNGEIFIDPSGNVVVVPPGATPVWGVVGVTVTNPGSGYAPNERPAVAFTGIPNAVYEAFAAGSFPTNIVAAEDVRITGGGNVLLSSVVQSNAGDVDIASVSGNLDLSADTFLAHAVAGGVTLTSSAGTVAVQQVTADDAVSISGARGVEIEGLVNSATGSVTVDATAGEAMIHTILAGNGVTVGAGHDVTLQGTISADDGDISITSRNRDLDFTAAAAQLNALQGGVNLAAVNGTIMSPPTLHASKNVTLTSFNTLALNNEITSDTGVIDLKSTSGSINLGSNLDARDDSIRIHAKGSVTQIGGGIGFVRVLNGGSGYTAAATVAIAAPSGGGIAARAMPIIGRVNGVDGVITGIRITNPGSGYGAGEQPAVTFTRNAVPPAGALDASAMAVASPALGNSGLAAIDVLDGGSGYTATTIVTIAAPVGGGTAATAQAVIGTVEVNGVMRDGVILDIVIVNPGSGYGAGEQPVVTITGAGTGAVARAIANIALQDIRAGQDIDIYAGTGVTLLNTIRADQGHVSITSETGNVNLAARTLLVSSFMDDIEITSRRGAITVQRLAAGGDIALKAQMGVTLLNAVNSTGDFGSGDVSIYTVNGNIAAVAPNGLISVQNGGVSLESVNGTILVPQVFNVTGDVSLKTFGNLTIDRPLTSSAGSVTLASATGAVNIAANVFADERVTLSAKTGISQTKGFLKGNELVASNSTTSAVNLSNPANDFANVSLMSLGAVSYVDANDFETGVERSPYSGTPLGVEVRGESLNLSSVGTNSRIRVVSGLSYKTLSIAAGTQGGNNVGYVEYVTTSAGDNPQANAAFRGTLRDMIRYVNDNTATYVNAGNTRVPQPQMMVFDETGYLVEEVAPGGALPAFTRPVWFDGGRLEETATANRLGISGNNVLPHGLSFAAATPAVTGVRPATPGSAGSRVESLAVYGFTKGSGVVLGSGNNTVVDMHAGLKADGTVSANMIGLDVRGAAAINNTIGEQVVDAETVNRFAGNTLAGIMIRSGAAGTQVFGSVIGDATGANPALANGDGIQIVNATRSQIGSANAVDDDLYATRSNIIAGNLSAGVRISNAVAGTLAAANVVRNNVIRGNRTGVEISASAFAVLGGPDAGAANVITGQTLSGVVVTDSRSVQIQGNRIGIMAAYGDQPEAVAGNGVDGIAISGKSQGVEIGGGNWIGGNTAHGVRIGTGVTGVMMTGNRIGGELADGSAAGNGQDGVAITAAIGNTIGSGNVIARNGRHGVSITDARAETLLAGNRVFGSTISGNQSNGVLLGGGSRTTIGGPTVADANLIQGNVGDGVRLVSTSVTGAATGHVIQRNYVGANPAGDVNSDLGNKGSGVALVGTSDVVVGDANVVMNNGVDGIAVNGGRGVTIGSANAAVGNQIRSNARHGVSFSGAATGGRVMGNLIEGQGGDGVFVGNGARDVRIGHIVTQSAVTGAANVVRGNAGWGVRVMPGAQQIAVQGNSSFGNVQGALSRAAGANAAAPSSVTLTSAVMRTATGGTRQLVVTGTIAGARARQQYSVDVYASSVGESAQGRRHLGRFNVTATADGPLRFSSTITATVAVDEWISVAATTLVFDPGSTSQLSAPVRAVLRR